ncbi:MAG TPA: Zn-dependent hydrolase [Methylomirabilota bacterium]|nr:Zn-dependent hydrolase [Methylomirabilota bacterium]
MTSVAPDQLRIDLARLRRDVEALAGIGRDSEGGLSRPAWSPAHEEARAWLVARLSADGLTVRVDPAGNIFGRLGEGERVVLTGSHIDTVPRGGPLDGALGVLAGLECLRTVAQAGLHLPHALEVAAFTDEEGRFYGLFGSRAMTGTLDLALAGRLTDPEGLPLHDAMRRAGFDLARAPEARRDPATLAGYVELHIEQGPWLEEAGIPIGVVEGIVGIRRHRLTFVGQPDHAGTTPMDRRRDAFFTAAEYATRSRALVVREGAGRAVTTIGVVSVHPGVPNIVPARAVLLQELRDPDPTTLDRLARRNVATARRIAKRRGLTVEAEELLRIHPMSMAPAVQAAIEAAAMARGLAVRRMPSGAAHDAQILAAVTEAGMIFVPSQGGRSHRPDEWTDWAAIEPGVNVLLGTLLRLAAPGSGSARTPELL